MHFTHSYDEFNLMIGGGGGGGGVGSCSFLASYLGLSDSGYLESFASF